MTDSAFFSSPPLGVERRGEAGAAEVIPGVDQRFSCDFRALPTSPDLSAPMGREEK
jgi:hypothetical protein